MEQRHRAGIRRRSKTQGDLGQEFISLSISKKKDRSNKKNQHAVDDSVFCGFKTSIYKKSGDRHEGYYKDGKRDGHGIYLWANGDKYSGIKIDAAIKKKTAKNLVQDVQVQNPVLKDPTLSAPRS